MRTFCFALLLAGCTDSPSPIEASYVGDTVFRACTAADVDCGARQAGDPCTVIGQTCNEYCIKDSRGVLDGLGVLTCTRDLPNGH